MEARSLCAAVWVGEKQDILELYNFLDFMMTLPESLSQQFDIELEAFEESKKMKYVTTIERRAEARGIELGERSLVKRLLTRRFGDLQESIGVQISSLTIAQLKTLGDALLNFTAIDDLTHWLDNQSQCRSSSVAIQMARKLTNLTAIATAASRLETIAWVKERARIMLSITPCSSRHK